MTGIAVDARARFLEASAHHYALSAPATSAYLMSQRDIEAVGNKLPTKKGKSEATCEACSSILLPGWTSQKTITTKNGSKTNRSGKKISSAQMKYVRTSCLVCHRYKEEPLCEPYGKGNNLSQIVNPRGVSHTGKSGPVATTSQQATKPTTSSNNSKQRAKARKQSGLQAMLDKSKASMSSSSGFGLDLLDLMKQN